MPRKSPQTEDPSVPTENQMTQAEATKTPKKSTVFGDKLTGQELVTKAGGLIGQPIDIVAKECGYYKQITDNETGEVTVRVLREDFTAAMLKAQTGMEFAPPTRPYSRRTSRSPLLTVGGNGNIVVGNRYSSIAEFVPGGKVKVEAVKGKITITVNDGEEEAIEEDDQDELGL